MFTLDIVIMLEALVLILLVCTKTTPNFIKNPISIYAASSGTFALVSSLLV